MRLLRWRCEGLAAAALLVNVFSLLPPILVMVGSISPTTRSRSSSSYEEPSDVEWSWPSCEQATKEALVEAIRAQQLSKARFLALEALQAGCTDENALAALYQQQQQQQQQPPTQQDQQDDGGAQQQQPLLSKQVVERLRVQSTVDPNECWTFKAEDMALDLWDLCCSQLKQRNGKDSSGDDTSLLHFPATSRKNNNKWTNGDADEKHHPQGDSACTTHGVGGRPLCCEFHAGTSSYLHLPVLRELAVRVRVQTDDDVDDASHETYDLEQDGFLRRFDAASVLWPSGYLLGLCVAAPSVCGVPELYEAAASSSKSGLVAIELGAGVGLPSIALARTLDRDDDGERRGIKREAPRVIATDIAPHALALTKSNALAAHASVATALLDHYNETALADFLRSTHHQGSGFSILLGSALQALFDESTVEKDHHLWKSLDSLLDSSGTAIALLSHTIHSLQVPHDGLFQRIRTVSGDRFGMKTRWGEKSDFEISVFRRVAAPSDGRGEEL